VISCNSGFDRSAITSVLIPVSDSPNSDMLELNSLTQQVLMRLGELIATRSQSDVSTAILDLARTLGAYSAAAFVVERGDDLVLVEEYGLARDELARQRRLTITANADPMCRAASGHVVVRSEIEDTLQLALALRCRDGRLMGALSLRFTRATPTPSDHQANLFAGLIAEALDRANDHDALVSRRADLHRLLGQIAHDLRNPLNVIAICTEIVAATGPGNAAEPRVLDSLRRSTSHASELVKGLLAFAQAEFVDEVPLAFEPADLVAIVALGIEDARTRNSESVIVLRAPTTLPGEWNSAQISQCVGNLLANAQQYGDTASPVHVRLKDVGERVYLEVQNAGPAISPSRLGHIFDAFARGDGAATKHNTGIGLGLFIVKQLIEGHGGRIWVTSDAQSGTTFSVELPRVAVKTSPQARVPRSPPPAALAPTSPSEVPMLSRVRDPALRDLLDAYCQLCAPLCLPHPKSLDRIHTQKLAADTAMVRRATNEIADGDMLILEQVGAALEYRLGKPLCGVALNASETEVELGTLVAAYQRSIVTAKPVYEFAKFRGSDAPTTFERLILPFSNAGNHHVTHLMGVVRFSPSANPLDTGELAMSIEAKFHDPDVGARLDAMSPAALDALPFGVIKLDTECRVLTYSRTEARQAGYSLPAPIGANFFHDLAPCMDTPQFRGMIDKARAAGTLDLELVHIGDFDDRTRQLNVRVVAAQGGGTWHLHSREAL
jgi:photoactive yellow protein